MTIEENTMAVDGEEALEGALDFGVAAYGKNPRARSQDVVEFEESVVNEAMPKAGSFDFAALCHSLDNRSLGYRLVKRAFDIVFSLCVCAIGFIPAIFLSVAVALDTGGAPIYSQVRVGKRGKLFRIYKFRSMVADSDNVEKYFSPAQLEEWRREHKVENDPRITRLGYLMRKLSIDELPQFVNVLLGQISIIGPRAITLEELKHFGKDAALLLSVEPGITGAWQSGPRNQATFESGLRQTIELNYARNASFLADLRIFFGTLDVIFVQRTGK